MPKWVTSHGAAAAVLAALGFVFAAVFGLWQLTLGLFAAGLLVAVLGVRRTRSNGEGHGFPVLVLCGALCGLGLLVALAVPSLLNPFWAVDTSVRKADPDRQVQVPRDAPRGHGETISADDWTDAATDAIRQNDVVVRVDAIETEPAPVKGGRPQFKIHLRLANVGYERYIPFEGFTRDGHLPALTDESGRSYPFVEERRRKRNPAKGRPSNPEFEAASGQVQHVVPNRNVERLLVFEGVPARTLKLELPAAAWDRRGVFKFRISLAD